MSFTDDLASPADLALLAAARGTLEHVRAALAAGASLDAIDDDGCTPLIVAAYWNRDPEVARCLIEAGASLDARSRNGSAALHGFAFNDQSDLITFAVQRGAPVDPADASRSTPLMVAVEQDARLAVQALLALGARLEHQEDTGNIAFNFATSVAVVALLVAAGQDVNRRNGEGQTALMRAAWTDNLAQMAALLENGADPDLRDNVGYGAMHYAYSAAMVDALVKGGVRVNTPGEVCPPLLSCVLNRRTPEVLRALVGAGAALDARGPNGQTALLASAMHNTPQLFAVLFESGADPSLRTDDGSSLDAILEKRPETRIVYDSYRAHKAMRGVLDKGAGTASP